jgi:hypothetical protein
VSSYRFAQEQEALAAKWKATNQEDPMRTQMPRAVLVAGATLALIPGRCAVAQHDEFARGFLNPSAAARAHTWWHWINGNITREGITADLEAMKRAGIGGAQIFNVEVGIPAGNVPFMSDRWQQMIVHAAREANRLGIELCIHNCAGWSSSGGPWIKPPYAMQMLVFSEKTVHGPAAFSEALPNPTIHNGYYRDIEVVAFKTPPGNLRIPEIGVKAAYERGDRIHPAIASTPPGQAIPRDGIVNLTGKMDAAGRLAWDVPDGEWTILRVGHTPTGATNHPAAPEGLGLEVDKLSREALDRHWDGMMARIIADLGPLAGRILNNVLIDSYEVGSQNSTPHFRDEIQRRRRNHPLPFLPVVAGRVVDQSHIHI